MITKIFDRRTGSNKGQEVAFEGCDAVAVNSPVLSSEIGNHIYTKTEKSGLFDHIKGNCAEQFTCH